MKKINILLTALVALLTVSCSKDYLNTAPTQDITDKNVFESTKAAAMALEGIHRATYMFYGAHDRFGQMSVAMQLESMGEDCYPTEEGYGWFYSSYRWLDHRIATDVMVEYFWDYYYELISNANMIIANADKIPAYDKEIPQITNMKAQSYVYRAYSHFNLVQMYAEAYVPGGANSGLGIPYMDAPVQVGRARNTIAEVYDRTIKDLDSAIILFKDSNYPRTNKSHIDLSVAYGVYARVALVMGNWEKAAQMARLARNGYTLTTNYTSGFNKTTDPEWIWGVLINNEQATGYASFFSHMDPFAGGYNSLGGQRLASTTIIDYMSKDDVRAKCFLNKENENNKIGKDTYFDLCAGKYRTGFKFTAFGTTWANDYLYMKAGEMYLIEAEAEAMLGNDGAAQQALYELVVNRDPSYVKSTKTGKELKDEIKMQRRCDLWGEGHRWFDLKRYGEGMSRTNTGQDPAIWNYENVPAGSKLWVWLIPQQEMDSNDLMKQNP